jgi:hypothetical protein
MCPNRNTVLQKQLRVFDKLWKDTFEEKPWLQLVLQNTIYAFIENPGYTLAEFPYFYRDSRFREAIASNTRFNHVVRKSGLILAFGQNGSRKINWRRLTPELRQCWGTNM